VPPSLSVMSDRLPEAPTRPTMSCAFEGSTHVFEESRLRGIRRRLVIEAGLGSSSSIYQTT